MRDPNTFPMCVDIECSAGMEPDCVARSVAPILTHFVHRVAERSRDLGLGSVWFLAREGFLLKKLYESLSSHLDAPPARYMCVSRTTTTPASMRGFGPREVFLSRWNGEGDSLRTLVSPLCLDAGELDALARRHGMSPDEGVDPWSDPRFHRLVTDGDVQAAARLRGETARRDLMRYLDACGFSRSGSVGVTDVGWGLQIQENLEIALGGEGPAIHGLYMVLRRMAAARRRAGTSAEGLVHDPEAGSGWAEASALSAVDVFEDICRAPHPSVVGYDLGVPVLADARRPSRMAETVDDPVIARLQRSILGYAERYATLLGEGRFEAADTRTVAVSHMARLTRFPNRREATVLGSLSHSLGSECDGLVARRQPPSRLRLRATRHHVAGARWREAAAGSAFGWPGQLYVARSWLANGSEAALPVTTIRQLAPHVAQDDGNVSGSSCQVERDGWRRHAELVSDVPVGQGTASGFRPTHAVLLALVGLLHRASGSGHRSSVTVSIASTVRTWARGNVRR